MTTFTEPENLGPGAPPSGGAEALGRSGSMPKTSRRGSYRPANLGVWLGITWLALIVLAALLAPVLPIQNPNVRVGTSWIGPFSHWPEFLGTDQLGRSELSRIIYGARLSLAIGLAAALIGLVAGGLFGLLAGYSRRRIDGGVGVITDSFLAIPPLVLLLSVSAILRPSATTLVIALSFYAFPTFVRLTRANAISFADREFVLAAKALGSRPRRIVFGEVLPNVLPPLVAYLPLVMAVLIIAEASLSFLGLGVRPPTPTWGGMIADGLPELRTYPYLMFVPAAGLFLTIYSVNLIGEWLRSRFDVATRKL